MNQGSISSRNQVDVGVTRKNKINKFFRTYRIAQIDFFLILKSSIAKLVSKKILSQIISYPKVI